MIGSAPRQLQNVLYLFHRYNTFKWTEIQNFSLLAQDLHILGPKNDFGSENLYRQKKTCP